MNESILITGANAGLGKEAARQLAMRKETQKVILFCRNRAKAEAAKIDLEKKTNKKIFEIVIGDVSNANSVRKAVEDIREPIDRAPWRGVTERLASVLSEQVRILVSSPLLAC